MKLISAELRKLFASRSLVFLLVLLTLDFVLTAFLARPLPVEKAAREVYEIYLAEPETLIEYKKQLEENFFEHLRDDLFEMPSTFTEGADDLSVLSRVLDRADYIENYRAEISEIADSAARRAEDLLYFGYSEDSYYVREQRRLRDVYSELADALDGVSEYAYGYDAYLEGGRVCLFITVWLIFSVSFVFRNDRVCGFGSIMRTARCGRLDTAFSKLAAALLIGVVSTLLFLGTDFVAVYLAQGGFSSPSMPIQSLPDYAEVPFETTILGFIALVTAFRVAAAIILVLFVALISSIGFNYVSVFGISSLFAAANYLVFSRDYHGSAPAIKYLNIAAAAEGVELFAFGRYLSVFGKPTAYTAIFIPLAAAVAVVFTAFSVFIYCKNPKLPSPSFKRLWRREGKTRPKRGTRTCILLPLWVYELKKNRVLSLTAIILILLAARCMLVYVSVGNGATYGEAIYYQYISQIKDVSAEERRRFLDDERAALEEILLEYKKNTEAFESGEIPYEEYSAFLRGYYDAKEHEKVLARVEEYSAYAERKGCGVVYDTGYEELFSLGTDWLLFAAIVASSVGVFAVEYRSGNCAQIIKATGKGRAETFLSKLFPYTFIGGVLGFVFRAAGFAVTACRYELSDLGADLCAVRTFEAVPLGILIKTYILTDLVCSAVSSAMLACTVCLISCAFKKNLQSLGAVGVALAIPALLNANGTALVALNSPVRAFCTFGGSYIAFAATVAAYAVAALLLSSISFLGFCKTR